MNIDTLKKHGLGLASCALATAALVVALTRHPSSALSQPQQSGQIKAPITSHPIYMKHMLSQPREGSAVDPSCKDGIYDSVAALPTDHPGCEYREAGPAAYAWCEQDRKHVILRSLDRGIAIVVDCTKDQ